LLEYLYSQFGSFISLLIRTGFNIIFKLSSENQKLSKGKCNIRDFSIKIHSFLLLKSPSLMECFIMGFEPKVSALAAWSSNWP